MLRFTAPDMPVDVVTDSLRRVSATSAGSTSPRPT